MRIEKGVTRTVVEAREERDLLVQKGVEGVWVVTQKKGGREGRAIRLIAFRLEVDVLKSMSSTYHCKGCSEDVRVEVVSRGSRTRSTWKVSRQKHLGKRKERLVALISFERVKETGIPVSEI